MWCVARVTCLVVIIDLFGYAIFRIIEPQLVIEELLFDHTRI